MPLPVEASSTSALRRLRSVLGHLVLCWLLAFVTLHTCLSEAAEHRAGGQEVSEPEWHPAISNPASPQNRRQGPLDTRLQTCRLQRHEAGRFGGRCCLARIPRHGEGRGATEVRQLGGVTGNQEDIGGCQIAMEDLVPVDAP